MEYFDVYVLFILMFATIYNCLIVEVLQRPVQLFTAAIYMCTESDYVQAFR
jgi:hypothetical protein